MRSRAGLVGDVLVAGCGAGVTRHDLAFCIGNLVVRGVAAPASRSKACHVARAVASRQKESYRRRGCFAGNSDHVSGSRGVTALGRRHERAKSEGWTSPDAWFLGKHERRARPSSRPSCVSRRRVLPRDCASQGRRLHGPRPGRSCLCSLWRPPDGESLLRVVQGAVGLSSNPVSTGSSFRGNPGAPIRSVAAAPTADGAAGLATGDQQVRRAARDATAFMLAHAGIGSRSDFVTACVRGQQSGRCRRGCCPCACDSGVRC